MKIYRISSYINNSKITKLAQEDDDVEYALTEENNWNLHNYQFYFDNPQFPYVIDIDNPLDQFELYLNKLFITKEDSMQAAMQAAVDHYKGYLNPQEIQKITPYDKIEKLYGTTERFDKAGYIMENGELVNLNRPHTDHREVTIDGRTKSMQEFIADGNIRMSFNNGYAHIDIYTEPSQAQYTKIYQLINKITDGISVDLTKGLGELQRNDCYEQIDRDNFQEQGSPDPQEIINRIKQYYKRKHKSKLTQFLK